MYIDLIELSSYLSEIPSHTHTLLSTQSDFDWRFITQSRVLQVDWMILDNNEKTTIHINMP